ncbi:hypothetical protein K4L44_06555 [Halosquirtibacter laminarini]|uniref:Uncharacterized protein n=1 Tax=Halosquirtibacter laminarini TaxID=3374600 RepID=A0AC61NIH4_9BACT|nr:hypothetical protein K4L44_06555 [Prolixibacteraceae bacterium]
MTKYLYGAAVQGIQSFIFKTNKLKEIVGASELVDQICSSTFAKALADAEVLKEIDKGVEKKIGRNFEEKSFDAQKHYDNNNSWILGAAGNIKYLFDSKEACEKVVCNFPRIVMEKAPGITISQAVVKVDGDITVDHINLLEQKLKAERNKPTAFFDGVMGVERSRRTGDLSHAYDLSDFEVKAKDLEHSDIATQKKLRAFKGNQLRSKILMKNLRSKDDLLSSELSDVSFPYNFSELKANNTNDDDLGYLAVIHADGNSLGRLLQGLANKARESNLSGDDLMMSFKSFSLALNEATLSAANLALNDMFHGRDFECAWTTEAWKDLCDKNQMMPMRPIILGGDDLTMVCDARYALDFTTLFLEHFKATTRAAFDSRKDRIKGLKYDYLTACAGIAFIKMKYPIYYGVHLAEDLCGESKKKSKEMMVNKDVNVPTSLAFYKVESSFYDSYKEVKNRALTVMTLRNLDDVDNALEESSLSFAYGPYLLDPVDDTMKQDKLIPSLSYLHRSLKDLEKAKDAKQVCVRPSALRRWLSECYHSVEQAEELRERMVEVLKERSKDNANKYRRATLVGDLDLKLNKGKGNALIQRRGDIWVSPVYDLISIYSLLK